jgi:hypothetical protein
MHIRIEGRHTLVNQHEPCNECSHRHERNQEIPGGRLSARSEQPSPADRRHGPSHERQAAIAQERMKEAIVVVSQSLVR